MDRRSFLQLSGAAAVAPLAAACDGVERLPVAGVPRSSFGKDSTAEEVTEGLDLSNNVAVITGCNSGIGFEAMRVLALRGAYVIGTGRTLDKAKAACAKVTGSTSAVQLELSEFDSVVACAKTIRGLNAPIDMLICNAGMRGGDLAQINGVEKHLMVNHLGHFLFVNHLIDRMYYADQGRVVIVGSRAAYRGAPDDGIEFDNISGVRDYSVSKAYGQSKLANALFSLELSRRLRGSRITSNALHPGVINTNIARGESALLRRLFGVYTSIRGKTIEQGAATTCYVAASPVLGEVSGAFFEDCNAVEVTGDHHLHDTAMAERLWQLSETLAGDYLIRHERPTWNPFEDRVRDPHSISRESVS